MKNINIRMLVIGSILTMIATLSACSTVEGVGKDVEALGDEIQDASN